jgi:predicted nucleotidyltransferase
MEDPHEDHLAAMKQILGFVAEISDVGVFYPKGSGGRAELQGYSDIDLAGDLDSRKSTTGVLFFHGRSPVS